MDDENRYRLIGSRHECARMLIWVREQIGSIREKKRITPERFTRQHAVIDAVLMPLLTLERRMLKAHDEQRASPEKE